MRTASDSHPRVREWQSRHVAFVGGLLLFETLSGLSIYLLPFSVTNQLQVMLHTAVGLVFLLQAAFMLGLSYVVSTGAVFVRDIVQLVPIVTTVWFFFTPIFYFGLPAGAEAFQWMLEINPVYHLLAMYRAIFVFQPAHLADFPWRSMAIFAAVACVLLAAGYRVFIRKKVDFADEL